LTVLVIVVIGLAWVAFLGPTIMRARNRQGRTDSVGDFSHRLSQLLGRTNGRHGDGRHGRPARFRCSDPSSPSIDRPDEAPEATPVSCSSWRLRWPSRSSWLSSRSVPFYLLNLLADAALVAYMYVLIQIRHQTHEQCEGQFLGSAYQRPRRISSTGRITSVRGIQQPAPRSVETNSRPLVDHSDRSQQPESSARRPRVQASGARPRSRHRGR
jgi:hypothetical protein